VAFRSAVAALAVLVLAGPGVAERLEGFSSLKIGPGVREAAMGGAGAAAAFGPQAIATNPAATAGIDRFGVTAAYTRWFLDTYHQSVFAARDLGFATVGAGVVNFSAGRFEYRTQPSDEPLGEFEPADFSFYLNFARRFGSMTDVGITGRYYFSKIVEHSAAGLGFDVGARVSPLAGLCIGASLVDFGKTMSYVRDVFWLPSRLRLGAGYSLRPGADLRLTGTVDGSYYIYREQPGLQAGVEFAWRELLALRAGYDPWAGASRLNFGAGVRVGFVSVDYALSPLRQDLGLAHRISVGLAARPSH
jgi:hypothetical protein